jgi:hypothetical protein
MTPRRARRRRWRDRRPWHVGYVLTNWKLRVGYIVLAACIGVWMAHIRHANPFLGLAVGICGALLRIWLEVRQHEPRD